MSLSHHILNIFFATDVHNTVKKTNLTADGTKAYDNLYYMLNVQTNIAWEIYWTTCSLWDSVLTDQVGSFKKSIAEVKLFSAGCLQEK